MNSVDAENFQSLILTGFAPFDGHEENPSELLALEFDGMVLKNRVKIQSLILPVAFEHCFQELAQEIEQHFRQTGSAPHSIVSLGLNPKAHKFQVEKVALNFQYTEKPDNEGQMPKGQKIRHTGADAYFTSFPVERIVEELNGRDSADNDFGHKPYELSLSAGSYVCNTLYYRVLDYLQQSRERFPQTHGLFCHVPIRKGKSGTFAQTIHGQKQLLQDLLEALVTP